MGKREEALAHHKKNGGGIPKQCKGEMNVKNTKKKRGNVIRNYDSSKS